MEDFRVIRAIVEAANFLPAVWLLNRLSGIYFDIACSITGTVDPPADYVESHEEVLSALERGDGPRAAQLIEAYLEKLDNEIVTALEVFL